MVDSPVNRELFGRIALAAAVAGCAVPAFAKDPPKPSLSIDPIVARTLLAPVDEARGPGAAYRLDPGLEPASGQRARLSLEVGDSTLYALTGRLSRQPGPPGPLDAGHAKALGIKRPDSGKVYGAGVSRKVGGIDVSATYQYSKISAENPAGDDLAHGDGPGKSHSLRGTMRIRFRP
jgi:hypothetical protein